jgi:hypothetical protein
MRKKVEVIHHIIDPSNFGGLGVMATHFDGDSYVEIATEPCSYADQYSKKVAVEHLRNNYAADMKIRVPINKRRNVTHREVRDFVVTMFG